MNDRRDSEWLRTLSRCRNIGLWDAVLHDGDPLHRLSRWTWSHGFRRLLGFDSQAEFPDLLQSWRRRVHPEDLAPTLRTFRATCATGADLDMTYRLRLRDGSFHWFRAAGGTVRDGTGRARRACGSLTDIQDLVQTDGLRGRHDATGDEAELVRLSEQRLSVLIQSLSDVVLIVGRDRRVLYQSPTVETTWGYPPAALVRWPLTALVHPDDRRAVDELWRLLCDQPGGTGRLDLRLRQRHGTWRHVELVMNNLVHKPLIGGIVVTAHDIEQRKTYERQLVRQAFYDTLTGLPNRALCQDRLDMAVMRKSRVALLIADLDGFKLVNDGLGHAVGDQLLVAAAQRLLTACGPDDTVARPGGDEFIVIRDGLPDATAATGLAEAVTRAFERPFMLNGRNLTVTASVGVSVGEAGQCSADTLLRNADLALFRAKAEGKGRAVLFDPSMDNDGVAELELEAELRRALERGELRVHYQPIVELGTERLLEVEALARWNHPTRGLLSPADFIPLAEATGLIIPLGRQVLVQGCRQMALWHAAYPSDPPMTLSVNLSPRQFGEPMLDTEIATVLRRTGLEPTCLKLEITEGVVMDDIDRAIPILEKLKASGVRIAIDDFGTGYASFSSLKRLPLDVLKIDRSFVNGIERNADDVAIVRAIVTMAKSLRLSVTAEGIEIPAQAEILTTLCCDRGQGYLFSRPVEAAAITRMIEARYRPIPALAMCATVPVSPARDLAQEQERPVEAA